QSPEADPPRTPRKRGVRAVGRSARRTARRADRKHLPPALPRGGEEIDERVRFAAEVTAAVQAGQRRGVHEQTAGPPVKVQPVNAGVKLGDGDVSHGRAIMRTLGGAPKGEKGRGGPLTISGPPHRAR